ncbi:hypothetical protein [Vibrio splendidus]|uniref:hypothetical protein n=1 Tax=Vibrio splendidus TaxID=29497 RepID=UPI00076A1CD8|nr:hypothetical protein [Vibrio splendidus]PHX03783.1 hypothetical protein VSPL_48030 [Vibrio splendidus]
MFDKIALKLARNLNALKRRHVKRLASDPRQKKKYKSWKTHNCNDVGLDYNSKIYWFTQMHADDILENYVKWFSYFDDSEVALESYHNTLLSAYSSSKEMRDYVKSSKSEECNFDSFKYDIETVITRGKLKNKYCSESIENCNW